MSAIIENKWDINYIKKCAQHKTLHTLKNDAFELPGNKNIRNLFLKFELFSLDQANLRSDSSQKLLLHPKSSSPLPTETVLQHNLIMWSSSFSLFYPTLFEDTPQLWDISNHMPSQVNQIYYQDICKS